MTPGREQLSRKDSIDLLNLSKQKHNNADQTTTMTPSLVISSSVQKQNIILGRPLLIPSYALSVRSKLHVVCSLITSASLREESTSAFQKLDLRGEFTVCFRGRSKNHTAPAPSQSQYGSAILCGLSFSCYSVRHHSYSVSDVPFSSFSGKRMRGTAGSTHIRKTTWLHFFLR